MNIKTNDDIKQARDYGVQAFREARAGDTTEDKNLHRLLNKDGADVSALLKAWKAGFESAQRAEFI